MTFVVYDEEPNFPATDQHPSAVRYFVAGKWIDTDQGEPTEGQVAQARAPAITPQANGAALDERQKKTAKDEAAALAKSGDLEAAFNKILELI